VTNGVRVQRSRKVLASLPYRGGHVAADRRRARHVRPADHRSLKRSSLRLANATGTSRLGAIQVVAPAEGSNAVAAASQFFEKLLARCGTPPWKRRPWTAPIASDRHGRGMKPDAADNSVSRETSTLLSKERLIPRKTGRAVTPLGGVAVFVAFLHELGSVEKLRQYMPIQWKSPNQIDPTTSSVEDEVALRAEPAVVAEGRGSRGGVLLGSERQKQPSRADFEGAQTSEIVRDPLVISTQLPSCSLAENTSRFRRHRLPS
jgi:hypothetical protein